MVERRWVGVLRYFDITTLTLTAWRLKDNCSSIVSHYKRIVHFRRGSQIINFAVLTHQCRWHWQFTVKNVLRLLKMQNNIIEYIFCNFCFFEIIYLYSKLSLKPSVMFFVKPYYQLLLLFNVWVLVTNIQYFYSTSQNNQL